MTSPTASPFSQLSARAPTIDVADPLAVFLGALSPGQVFHYTYEDAVKLAGHSCPTVAGGYLMSVAALRALYPDGTPVRGDIDVTVGGRADDGATGPLSQVVTLLTGAAADNGFGGLGGHFRRQGLLRFDAGLQGARFVRRDTGAAVEVRYTPHAVPAPPELRPLLAKGIAGQATPDEQAQVARLWHARVEEILTGDMSRVVQVTPIERNA